MSLLDSKHIFSAIRDPDCAFDAYRSIRAEALKIWSSREFSQVPSINQWLALVAIPEFPKSPFERTKVLELLTLFGKQSEILPYASDSLIDPSYYERELFIAKCLVGCGVFREALDKRSSLHGAPDYVWYRGYAKRMLLNDNQRDLADNFNRWVGFLRDYLV